MFTATFLIVASSLNITKSQAAKGRQMRLSDLLFAKKIQTVGTDCVLKVFGQTSCPSILSEKRSHAFMHSNHSS